MPDIVIAGAGIAGISTAFHLARAGKTDVVLCDPLSPLTLTSDKSTECYRNWWPGPDNTMVAFMNRSIDLFEKYAAESGDAFHLTRRGYLYATGDRDRLEMLVDAARDISDLGGGALRYDETSQGPGADVFTSGDSLRKVFPYLSANAVGGVHARRAGWLSAQQLGMWWLDLARGAGVRIISKSVESVSISGGRVVGVGLSDGTGLDCDVFVNAAGPLAPAVAAMTGVILPMRAELHLKVAFKDHARAVPRSAPMLIWCDPQLIPWGPRERDLLAAEAHSDLAELLPPYCHARPEGSQRSAWVLALWEYDKKIVEPSWPISIDPLYTEVVIRGLEAMIPALRSYRHGLPTSSVDGGYYTKTPENRPLIGPVGADGSFVIAALSGFGIMASAAGGELAADHILGRELPGYAAYLSPARYLDAGYLEVMDSIGDGQL